MKKRSNGDAPSPLDPLERGLSAGFGGDRRDSVLGSLERSTGARLSLVLPDPDADQEPVVKPVGSTNATALGARYEVLGEIARGGLGVVFKGRDRDLGRDVAVKVLHDRFKEDRQVTERFVEEAQIGGQLQHPGIVPVYELGLQDDDRPFFAMKLIKGQTLAELLRKRSAPSDSRPRFLSIFLQVCKTIAYAHARRVVHRDLKPSNIMVGNFGEVQVVDWGLAKVLRRGGVADETAIAESRKKESVIETVRSQEGSSVSIPGSLMGTPAYMSPEQARGEVERLDERSDVFSLGAVLCEILSGKPPFDADELSEVVRDAAACRHDAAFQRLESAQVEKELVELTRSCLAPSPDARPADAGEVAGRIESYLQTVEDRARKAVVRAAELRVRARSILTVGCLAVVGLIIAGGTYLGLDQKRQERENNTRHQAEPALAAANRLAGQAEHAGLLGAPIWQEALDEAKRAQAVVAAGEAAPELKSRVDATMRNLESRGHEVQAQAEKEAAHVKWLEQFVEVRIGPDVLHELYFWNAPKRREQESTRRVVEYEHLFREIGLNPSTSDAPAAAAFFDCDHRIRASLAFDAFAEATRVASLRMKDPDSERWRHLVRIARHLDPDDPWRNALRDELVREELNASSILGLASVTAIRERSAEEVALVVSLIDAAGDIGGAIQTQIEGLRVHPSDFWLNQSLSQLVASDELTSRRFSEVASWACSAALILRPDRRAERTLLALGDFQDGNPIGVETLRELLRETPNEQFLQSTNFFALMGTGFFDEAFALLPEAMKAIQVSGLDWEYAPFFFHFGYTEELHGAGTLSILNQVPYLIENERYDEAWTMLKRGRKMPSARRHIGFPNPFVLRARSAEDLRDLHQRWRACRDTESPELASMDAAEILAIAETESWFHLENLPVAVRLFQRAFDADPETKETFHFVRARQWAAFVSALASADVIGSQRITAKERSELRHLSLTWLHEELDLIERDLADPQLPKDRTEQYSRALHSMHGYGWLAPIREPRFLGAMPEEDAHACRFLWARIHGVGAMMDQIIHR